MRCQITDFWQRVVGEIEAGMVFSRDENKISASMLFPGISGGPHTAVCRLYASGRSRTFPDGKKGGPGDNGQKGKVTIPPIAHVIWIADQPAMTTVTFSQGRWTVNLATDSERGTDGHNCIAKIGQWDGSTFSPFDMQPVKISYSPPDTNTGTPPDPNQILTGLIKIEMHAGAVTVDKSNYLALSVTHNDAREHIIYTDEGDLASGLNSPESVPGYPIPELATGLLLVLGLAWLGVLVCTSRRRAASVR